MRITAAVESTEFMRTEAFPCQKTELKKNNPFCMFDVLVPVEQMNEPNPDKWVVMGISGLQLILESLKHTPKRLYTSGYVLSYSTFPEP